MLVKIILIIFLISLLWSFFSLWQQLKSNKIKDQIKKKLSKGRVIFQDSSS